MINMWFRSPRQSQYALEPSNNFIRLYFSQLQAVAAAKALAQAGIYNSLISYVQQKNAVCYYCSEINVGLTTMDLQSFS